ncbi:MAG: ArsC/Spx/MgsR family protein [Crocinitomicaceae bacterium]
MKKVYYLSTCSTCQRILKDWGLDSSFVLQDIKTEPITPAQIDEMIKLAGSAEALFSRRAMKYKSMGLASKDLKEADYRKLILEEYTFLSRPVLVLNDHIFVGNSAKTVAEAKAAIQHS